MAAFSPHSKERPEELAGEGELDLLIATDCISEGQNLQDCDYLINYDIHWNPVRIIQRFGRNPTASAHPTNASSWSTSGPTWSWKSISTWKQRVSGRMVLLDISATGEENLIELQSGNQMNDLEYRKKQLLKLQGRRDQPGRPFQRNFYYRPDVDRFLASTWPAFSKRIRAAWKNLPLGVFAVTTPNEADNDSLPPGIIFCLRAEGEARR